MATEKELRHKVVNIMKGWLGWSEVNGKFKAIIDLYNTQKPLPVGHKMKYTDEWCAATVTAAGMQAGLSDIILGECSCSRMIALYKAKGRWMEDDAYRPDIGDILMYCWKDGDNYATTDQTANPNHVGFVGAVNSNTMTIYEGNKGEAVATRTVPINGRYIRGYCLPDYASKATTIKTEAEEDDDMDISKLTDADIEALAARLDTVLSKKEPSDWSKEARIWAEGQNIISGDQAGNKKYKKPATREELVQILYNIENPS